MDLNAKRVIQYSDLSVDRKVNKKAIVELFSERLGKIDCFTFDSVTIYYQHNEWLSAFFGSSLVDIHYVEYADRKIVSNAFLAFQEEVLKPFGRYTVTFEVPSFDHELIQLLNSLRFGLIETRLHYFNNDLENFTADRYEVRDATGDDIPILTKVAADMRNAYDRFHSDINFSDDLADEYISKYVENSINGFADIVLVPSGESPAHSFLTANTMSNSWERLGYRVSKMVLSAVSAETNRGWYKKLISEMTYRLCEQGAQSIYMNTQSTNIAVFYTWEKLGYRLGRATHVLSYTCHD
jgi:dTDP-4-amino-4,6-dideoxy-D-galactose acyltransferase